MIGAVECVDIEKAPLKSMTLSYTHRVYAVLSMVIIPHAYLRFNSKTVPMLYHFILIYRVP